MAKKTTKTATKKKPMTKNEVHSAIAEKTGLTKKQVGEVFDAFYELIQSSLSAKGAGEFVVPGLMKLIRQEKPAQEGKYVRRPSDGEMVWSEPKPAQNVVKVRPLKGLKEMV